MIDFRKEVVDLICSVVADIDAQEVYRLIEIPPSYDLGDYAFPCFKLAKIFRKAPNLIAEELASKMGSSEYFEKIENKGPYLNFFIDRLFTETVLREIAEKKDKFAAKDIGGGRNIL